MPIENQPNADDLRSARLLIGVTQAQLAKHIGVSTLTIINMESFQPVRPLTMLSVLELFKNRGIEFKREGWVYLGAKRAPTPQAVGMLDGPRMRAARLSCKLSPGMLAGLSRVRVAMVHQIERSADLSEGMRPATLYAVFTTLEADGGYFFGMDASRDFQKTPLPVNRADY